MEYREVVLEEDHRDEERDELADGDCEVARERGGEPRDLVDAIHSEEVGEDVEEEVDPHHRVLLDPEEAVVVDIK